MLFHFKTTCIFTVMSVLYPTVTAIPSFEPTEEPTSHGNSVSFSSFFSGFDNVQDDGSISFSGSIGFSSSASGSFFGDDIDVFYEDDRVDDSIDVDDSQSVLFSEDDLFHQSILFSSAAAALNPSFSPTNQFAPSVFPSAIPTFEPSFLPSVEPTREPTATPSKMPTPVPTAIPTLAPTIAAYYISTYAGDGECASEGDLGVATAASIDTPSALWADSEGSLYFNQLDCQIRKISASDHTVSHIAGRSSGCGQTPSGDGEPATAAVFVAVRHIWGDTSLNIYVADALGHNVRQILTDGTISIFAGNAEGKPGNRGDGGDATSARLYTPTGVGGDTNGNIFIASFTERKIRRVDGDSGIITTFAGTGTAGSLGDGGDATSAQLDGPYGVFVDSAGSVYITERTNNKVRKVDATTRLITTVAGLSDNSAGDGGIGGPATAAQLDSPYQSWVDVDGNLYIVDAGNRKLKRVAAFSGQIVTVAGTGLKASTGDGDFASVSSIDAPRAVWGLDDGDIFIADSQACNIRRLTVNPVPTATPTIMPTAVPSSPPTRRPSVVPTVRPSAVPSQSPTALPSVTPTTVPSAAPTFEPTAVPSVEPTAMPSFEPTAVPSFVPTAVPSVEPTVVPSFEPTTEPSVAPTAAPTFHPTALPSFEPTAVPSFEPTAMPSFEPTAAPSFLPTIVPSFEPTVIPSLEPTLVPSFEPTAVPSFEPTTVPSFAPSAVPSCAPTAVPSFDPTAVPSFKPTAVPSVEPTVVPSTASPTPTDSAAPSTPLPSVVPSVIPSVVPTTTTPSAVPSLLPSVKPSAPSALTTASPVAAEVYYISTYAGDGIVATDRDGNAATAASVDSPFGIWVDTADNLYLAESGNSCRVRKVDASTGLVSTFAGKIAGCGTAAAGDNGQATAATFVAVRYVWGDSNNEIYIVDTLWHTVRKVASNGIISHFAGDANGVAGAKGDGGQATDARLNTPTCVGGDTNGNIYITPFTQGKVRRVDSSGIITTFTYTQSEGGTGASFDGPYGVFVDTTGSIYVTEVTGHKVRRVDAVTNLISTIAGNGIAGDVGVDGPATSAQLNSPIYSWVDTQGNLFVADRLNRKIKHISIGTGLIETIAGTGGNSYSGDGGLATSAELEVPRGIWGTSSGEVFLADSKSSVVRRLTTTAVTSSAGASTSAASVDASNSDSSRYFGLIFGTVFVGALLVLGMCWWFLFQSISSNKETAEDDEQSSQYGVIYPKLADPYHPQNAQPIAAAENSELLMTMFRKKTETGRNTTDLAGQRQEQRGQQGRDQEGLDPPMRSSRTRSPSDRQRRRASSNLQWQRPRSESPRLTEASHDKAGFDGAGPPSSSSSPSSSALQRDLAFVPVRKQVHILATAQSGAAVKGIANLRKPTDDVAL